MAVAIAWLPGPAGTRRRVAKPSVEEPDAAEPARPDLWGARVSNDPGLPDPLVCPLLIVRDEPRIEVHLELDETAVESCALEFSWTLDCERVLAEECRDEEAG